MRQHASPIHLPVWQFLALSIITFGTYPTFWTYRTWKYLKESGSPHISPGWRTLGMAIPIVNFFIAFGLFRRIGGLRKKEHPRHKDHPAFLTALYGIGSLLSGWLGLLSMAVLAVTQDSLNAIKHVPHKKWRWSTGEMVACTFLTVFLSPIFLATTVLVVRNVVVPFQVSGQSMAGTLKSDDYVLVNRFAYAVKDPERGDIVVFKSPINQKDSYIMRIIGLPGEIVVIRGGNVHLMRGSGDWILEEPYLEASVLGRTYSAPPALPNSDETIYRIPVGEYFMLGDDRTRSLDSRSFIDKEGKPSPFIAREDIVGKVSAVAFPPSRLKVVGPRPPQLHELADSL